MPWAGPSSLHSSSISLSHGVASFGFFRPFRGLVSAQCYLPWKIRFLRRIERALGGMAEQIFTDVCGFTDSVIYYGICTWPATGITCDHMHIQPHPSNIGYRVYWYSSSLWGKLLHLSNYSYAAGFGSVVNYKLHVATSMVNNTFLCTFYTNIPGVVSIKMRGSFQFKNWNLALQPKFHV